MNKSDNNAFTELFKEACFKCFGQALKDPLTETESKLFCNQVLDRTGLSIGWKSVKNYSIYIIDGPGSKAENPSIATLDTLARYVLNAPYTTEIQRKGNEGHHPYWFLYKKNLGQKTSNSSAANWRPIALMGAGIVAVGMMFIVWLGLRGDQPYVFYDDFSRLSDSSLAKNGWLIKDRDSTYWNKRNGTPGELTLYTLKGDNWPDPANKQGIKNLLLHPIPYECFTAEVHLSNFIPKQEWQQAGILLLEDTILKSKSIRLSIAFNDYFAGYSHPNEILIQAVTSLGNGFIKPEEVAHKPIASPDSLKLLQMLQRSALRIEKRGNKFRFLYSSGITDNTAFKEVASQEFDMHPRYIGLFAIKGFKDTTATIPAHFTFFRIAGNACE